VPGTCVGTFEFIGKMKPGRRAPAGAEKRMKARVFVMLKDGVLDPQGAAVQHALGGLGFEGV